MVKGRGTGSGANSGDAKNSNPSRDVLALDDYRAEPSVEDQAITWLARLSDDMTRDEDPYQNTDFLAWLAADPAHPQAFEEISAIWGISGAVAANPVFQPQPEYRRGLVSMLSAAAVVLVALLVLFTSPDTFETQPGEQQRVILADGSTAFLNTDSAIRVQITHSERSVEVTRGEVWFDVVSESSRPFTVHTDGITATALGTAYAVHKRSATAVAVTVTEGTVAVSSPAAEEATTLAAGQQLLVDLAHEHLNAPAQVDLARHLAWQQGQLVYQDITLDELLVDLNRYVPRNMALSDAQVGHQSVSAVLKIEDQEAMLEALSVAMGLSWKPVSDELILITPRRIASPAK